MFKENYISENWIIANRIMTHSMVNVYQVGMLGCCILEVMTWSSDCFYQPYMQGMVFDLEKGSTLYIDLAKSNSRSKRSRGTIMIGLNLCKLYCRWSVCLI